TATMRPKARTVRILLSPIVLSQSGRHRSSDVLVLFDEHVPSTVGSERADAAGEAKDARSAFALDLLGAEPKRRDAAIHRQAIARRRAIERRRDAKDFAPPLAERNSKSALPAQF